MTDSSVSTSQGRSPRLGAFQFGACAALICVCIYLMFGIGSVISTITPYIAGVVMFVALLAIFGSIFLTLKKIRKNAQKQVAMLDCYVAIAVIGCTGYFLAACVQTFQAGGNPAMFWSYGAASAATFAALILGGKCLADLFNSGAGSKK